MGGYLVNFAVYIMAMTGLIFFALMVYKKFTASGVISGSKVKSLNVEETLSLGPRKTLYIVRVGEERFLIAGDVDKTSLISKLEDSSQNIAHHDLEIPQTDIGQKSSHNNMKENSLPQKHLRQRSVEDLPEIVSYRHKKSNSDVLHNMIRKINR